MIMKMLAAKFGKCFVSDLITLVSLTGAAGQEDTVHGFLGCSIELPPANNSSDLVGAFQQWYKSSVITDNLICTYTTPSGPLENGTACDVNYGFNESTANLFIKETTADNEDTYHFTQGTHAYVVHVNLSDLGSVWDSRITVMINGAKIIQTPHYVPSTVDEDIKVTAFVNEVDMLGLPEIIWTNPTGNIVEEEPGVQSFQADTTQTGIYPFSVHSELCTEASETYNIQLLVTAFVSSTEYVAGYVGCEQELPAETSANIISDSASLMFWARKDSDENVLSFHISINVTTYLADYNEFKYVINAATRGLVIKDITERDADLYIRRAVGTPDLAINFSVSSLSADDLNAVLVITYDGQQLTAESGTLTIAHGVNGHLHALASNIDNAGDPELVWVDAESGNSRSAVGSKAELSVEPGIFFVRSRLCKTEANSFNVTIIASGVPDTTFTENPTMEKTSLIETTSDTYTSTVDKVSSTIPVGVPDRTFTENHRMEKTSLIEVTSNTYTSTIGKVASPIQVTTHKVSESSTSNQALTTTSSTPSITTSRSTGVSGSSTTSQSDNGNKNLAFLAIPGGIIVMGIVIAIIYVVASSVKGRVTETAAYSAEGYYSGVYPGIGGKAVPYYGEYEYIDSKSTHNDPWGRHGSSYIPMGDYSSGSMNRHMRHQSI